MPNKASAVKRVRQSEKARQRNHAYLSRVRTFIKKVRQAIEAGDKKLANEHFVTVCSLVDKAAGKNIIHKNKAARDKSRLCKAIKQLTDQTPA